MGIGNFYPCPTTCPTRRFHKRGGAWPLVAGFSAAWLLRGLGVEPRTDLRLNVPTIDKHEVTGDAPIQEYLKWWLANDVQVGLVTTPFVEEAWRAGFRKPDHIPHDRLWDVSTAEAAWREMVTADMRRLASAPRDEFRKHLDETDALSTPTLIAAGNIAVRYDLPTIPSDIASVASSLPTYDELKIYAENYVADALVAARLRVLAWTFQYWHGERYELPNERT